ncbi:MAG TPA: transporter [Allosphingosinicella sp.]|nr:transporter [Allosphingosinicella sp.]
MRALRGLLLAVSAAGAGRAQEAPICTDRPAKANAVCTVPAGRIQIETGGISWSLTERGGARTELLTIGASVAKLGLSERSDLQVGFTPYAELRTLNGLQSRVSGIGDLVVRYKHRLSGADAPVQVAAIPFVKLPTAADGLGNDRVEGGLAIPISFALFGPVTMTLGPELDLLADADGNGRHIALVNLVNVSAPIAPRLTLAAEFWTNLNFDPDRTAEQASFDTAIAYAVSSNLQLDLGANIGLTRDTPDFEGYAGVSLRF